MCVRPCLKTLFFKVGRDILLTFSFFCINNFSFLTRIEQAYIISDQMLIEKNSYYVTVWLSLLGDFAICDFLIQPFGVTLIENLDFGILNGCLLHRYT